MVAESELQNITEDRGFAVDTTFVLFFLALEFGRSLGVFAADTLLMGFCVAVVVALPYFLPSGEKPQFGNWLFGRSLIAGFAALLGLVFQQTLGTVLPESFRFLPMTLLIVTAMLSCYIQFYSFFKFRLAK